MITKGALERRLLGLRSAGKGLKFQKLKRGHLLLNKELGRFFKGPPGRPAAAMA